MEMISAVVTIDLLFFQDLHRAVRTHKLFAHDLFTNFLRDRPLHIFIFKLRLEHIFGHSPPITYSSPLYSPVPYHSTISPDYVVGAAHGSREVSRVISQLFDTENPAHSASAIGTTATEPPPSATPVAAPTSSVAATSTAPAAIVATSLTPVSTVPAPDTTTSSLQTTSITPVSQTPVPPPTSSLPPVSGTTSSSLTTISTPPATDTATAAPQTQFQTTTQLVSASVTPSSIPNINLAASSNTPFFQNTAAVAGVFSALGVLVILVLIYSITRCVKSRRRRLLDRELAISFAPDNLHGHAAGDVTTHRRMPSVETTASSHDGYYTQPPVSHQEQYNYGFPQFDYASNGYYAGAGGGSGAVAVGPPPPAARGFLGGPQMAQAQQYNAAPLTSRAPAQRASPPPRDYISNYTTPPVSAESMGLSPTSNIPLSPPLPNPHGEQPDSSRVLKVANE
ncbi:hypothetical protein C8F04DRAFT_1252946 [Mycena alexandri]|uniref:Uncharacterized protein n=1 Tax=Mycena alexandri TaxID=1745969 RepID=A0AAD6T873_9AGAR|nr:hypothetical protein C8F04DRAFT_1252946 [Mycena alexandri]